MDFLEIQFWLVAKWLIIKGYGYHYDYEPDCATCKAGDVLNWITGHIELIKM